MDRSAWAEGQVRATAPHVRHLLKEHDRLDKAQDARLGQQENRPEEEPEEEEET